jgi:hypothetical protein
MKKVLSTMLLVSIGLFASAQQKIKIEDAAQHEGDSVTICSKVYGGRYMSNSKSAITLLNVGGLYPNALLTVLIKPENIKSNPTNIRAIEVIIFIILFIF